MIDQVNNTTVLRKKSPMSETERTNDRSLWYSVHTQNTIATSDTESEANGCNYFHNLVTYKSNKSF